MYPTTIGVDLAKQVFAIHGVDQHGKTVLRKTLRRAQMVEFFTRLTPCTVAMEACGTAHYWARTLQHLGHTVKLIAPQFVKPYVRGNKHDAADAAAICEAASRPAMRFVAVKTAPAQAVLALHRVRDGFIKVSDLSNTSLPARAKTSKVNYSDREINLAGRSSRAAAPRYCPRFAPAASG